MGPTHFGPALFEKIALKPCWGTCFNSFYTITIQQILILEAGTSLLFLYRITSKLESLAISMMVKSAVGYSTDLIKDILLAVQICLSQGGFAKLINQKEPYIKGVSPFFTCSCKMWNRKEKLSYQNIWKSPKKTNNFQTKVQSLQQYY